MGLFANDVLFWLIALVIVVGITVALILIGRSGSKSIDKDGEEIKGYQEKDGVPWYIWILWIFIAIILILSLYFFRDAIAPLWIAIISLS
jgi:hypothetical protein